MSPHGPTAPPSCSSKQQLRPQLLNWDTDLESTWSLGVGLLYAYTTWRRPDVMPADMLNNLH